MAALCAERGLSLLAYGSVLGGFLSERWRGAPPPDAPLENRSLVKYRLVIEEFGGWARFQAVLAAACVIGRKHGVSAAAVGLAWTLAQPRVAGVIAGARHARHLADTVRAGDLRLDDADGAVLCGLVEHAPGPSGETYALERVRGGAHAVIMKTGLNAEAGGG
jgi:aryl-alcohol dehydrogenase-like predicted oxidoreductase